MADVPGLRPFTKALCAKSAERTPMASPQRRLAKCQAKTPEGVMRLAGKIIEDGLPQPPPEIKNPKGPKYSERRCVSVDPNAYRAPLNRVRSPREERNRRPEGWTERWFVLPKVTVEGLRTVAIQFARAQQHSGWSGERLKYPRSVNYFVIAAANDLFRKLGFEQFCVEEQRPLKQRVRRFVAPDA
jgi:hypothetical protein